MIDLKNILGKAESNTLEYKAVLPPSKNIAQLIAAFANSNGGLIVLGVTDDLVVRGLSEDFHANSITHKALDLLSPKPNVEYGYVSYNDKKLYVIEITKSAQPVYVENRLYRRVGTSTEDADPTPVHFNRNGYDKAREIIGSLHNQKAGATSSQIKLIEHYQSVIKMIDDLGPMLYPVNANQLTEIPEGKILTRILFSSFVDNFETYLSDLLYEIYLANPSTLKSDQPVTVQEVLNCSDIQEFISYWAKQKLSRLQKGSVRGFLKENKQIRDLEALSDEEVEEIERILQIRHLYSHRNGMVDDKFLRYFPSAIGNTEYGMTINEVSEKLVFLSGCAGRLDLKAKAKYHLAGY